tara:strand:+ start:129 stop:821 length:693 start_codon:yes stop_codon:yes gene_type:complete
MKILNIFPSSIIQDKILIDKEIKKEMIEEIKTMLLNSKNKDDKGEQDSWTGDTQGFEYIFENEKFNILLQEIKKTIIKYIKHLGIDDDKIDIYMTRSWATVSNGKERILRHKHKQSHISFAYYLKKDLEDSNIVFYNEHFQNEIIPGLFTSRTMRAGGVLKQTNLFNASSLDIKIEEDDILVFPSKTLHGTQPNKLNKGRISISGDVICVAKNSELLETMMPPINNWNKM